MMEFKFRDGSQTVVVRFSVRPSSPAMFGVGESADEASANATTTPLLSAGYPLESVLAWARNEGLVSDQLDEY